jgi:hypothetical protein
MNKRKIGKIKIKSKCTGKRKHEMRCNISKEKKRNKER